MYNHKEIEQEILKFWKDNSIYEKVKKKNEKGEKFYFLDGPPYTSGKIHIGTAWNNCLKDMAMRFFRMRGFNVWDRAGYDTHGLPTENKVQKELGLKYKEEIESKVGVEEFVKKCRQAAEEGASAMSESLKSLGIWMDFDDPYITFSNDYIEGEWFFIKKAWEQNRIYRDKKIIHWCGDCETGLAKHELEYKNVEDESIFLRFKLKDKDDEYLIVWTTTPWTIPFNLAVMVNPELEYVKVKTEDGEIYIISKALANILMTSVFEKKYEVLETLKGSELKGLEYENPFYGKLKDVYDNLKKESPNVHTVILSEKYVDTGAGSGLVHCAPGCGPEDKEVGDEFNIPSFNTLNEQGEFEELGDFNKMLAKKDDKKFIKLLEENGALMKTTMVEHEYPHCWRCRKPVVFRATEQWFLKISDLVDKMRKENEKTTWVPKFGKLNYDRWTENLRDNSIVRQRYWGCPLPLWKCKDENCDHIEVIGSVKELGEKIGKKNVPKDLHKPWIDDISWECPKCKKKMIRDPDILDVWIDSGTAGWNCLRYPSIEKDFKELFPANLVLEATEQVRLWFSMLNICSTIAFGKKSYDACYMHGMINDWHGTKMSKSIGNIISPDEVIEKSGADGFRYYAFENSAGENMNFSWDELKVKQRNLNILYNLHNFILDLRKRVKPSNKNLSIEEKFIFSRKNSTIKSVTKKLENFRLDEVVKDIEALYLDLSRIYVRLVRDKANSKDAPAVLYTLENVFEDILKMFAIISPFISDKLYKNLFDEKESVHLCNWPKIDEKLIDEKLEKTFEDMLSVIESGLSERNKTQIGLKWPLPKIEIHIKDSKRFSELEDLIKSQLNVKEIIFKESKESEIITNLDTNQSEDFLAEGFTREMIRNVQAFRRKLGLEKSDKISLHLEVSKELERRLKDNLEFLRERTNSVAVEFLNMNKETFKNNTDFKIKDEKGVIGVEIN